MPTFELKTAAFADVLLGTGRESPTANCEGVIGSAEAEKRWLLVGVGTVLQFDEARGFGFIEADDGGEDVFVHASVLDNDERQFVRGARVGFESTSSERGRRATLVHILGLSGQRPAAEATAVQPQAPPPAPLPPAGVPEGPAVVPVREPDEADLLSPAEFSQELTDVLLDASPDLTASQIIAIRSRLLTSATAHGWIED